MAGGVQEPIAAWMVSWNQSLEIVSMKPIMPI